MRASKNDNEGSHGSSRKFNGPSRDPSNLPNAHKLPRFRRPMVRDRSFNGSRRMICLCLATTVLVMLANLSLLIVSVSRPTSSLGSKVLFQGTYFEAATRSTVGHLFINVASTLLLAASYATMQYLLAPTRANIDAAHSHGRWLYIGTQGLRNFPFIGKWRQIVWLLLFFSSIPLHLLYNSILIQTTATNEYYALLVSQDFIHGGPINTTLLETLSISEGATDATLLRRIQSLAKGYTNITLDDCLSFYGTPFIKDRSNVVLVTNVTTAQASGTNSSILLSTWFDPGAEDYSYSIFYQTSEAQDDEESETYYTEPYIDSAGTLPYLSKLGEPDVFSTAQIQYCLTQPAPGECTVELYQPLLGVVILVNLFKCLCLAWVLVGSDVYTPFVTAGDAVASFLARADPFTCGSRAVSRAYIEEHAQKVRESISATGALYQSRYRKPWRNERKRWYHGVGRVQRVMTLVMFLGWLIGFGILLGISFVHPTTPLADLQNNGFGHLYPADSFPGSLSNSLAANVLLSNIPQLLLSLFYMNANQALTQMYSAYETSLFAVSPLTLRVTTPRGAQRRSLWLGLPLAYSLPLMASSMALHWAVSQSLFLAEVNVVSSEGTIIPEKHINAVGFSLLALIIAYVLGAVMVITLLGIATCRKLPRGMPVLGGCSLAIAAACHGIGEGQGRGVVEVIDKEVGSGQVGGESKVEHGGWIKEVGKGTEGDLVKEIGKVEQHGRVIEVGKGKAEDEGQPMEPGKSEAISVSPVDDKAPTDEAEFNYYALPPMPPSNDEKPRVTVKEFERSYSDITLKPTTSSAGEEYLERPLMYGVIAITGERTGLVGFSSGAVSPLRDGWFYDGMREAPKPMGMRRRSTEETKIGEQ